MRLTRLSIDTATQTITDLLKVGRVYTRVNADVVLIGCQIISSVKKIAEFRGMRTCPLATQNGLLKNDFSGCQSTII